jgi:hypothetical protein
VHLSFASFESVPSFSRRFCPFTLRVSSFGPAAPLMYSKQDFGPSKLSLSASSAFEIFEAGLRSLELSLLGQQRLRDIRSRISVPRSYLFRPAAPSRYSKQDFVPRVIFFGPAAPSRHSKPDFGPSGYLFRASSAFEMSEAGLRSFELFLSTQ